MRIVALIVGLFAFGALAGFACGPKESTVIVESVENAAAVAQYKLLLDDCRAKGKAAKSYAVYETCADLVDAELCRTRSVRCAGGAK